MGLRETLNNNSSLITIVAVVVLVVALGIVVMSSRSSGNSPQNVKTYYYDLNTNKLFASTNEQIPPIETESGPTANGNKAGVMAYVYACGSCGDYAGMTIDQVEAAGAWVSRLEMYSPEAIKMIESAKSSDHSGPMVFMMMDRADAKLVKRPKDDKWVVGSSSQGMNIMHEENSKTCPNGQPKLCLP